MLSLVIIFKRNINPALIIGYAIAEGVLLGAITGWFNTIYPGIAAQAIVGTLGVFGGMLVVYKTGAIRVTPRLTKMIIGGIIGVAVLMLFNLIMGLFGINIGLRDGGALAIVFSLVCIALAAFSFLLDFDSIDQAIKQGAPAKHVVVLRLRSDGHPGVAVPGDPAAAGIHAPVVQPVRPALMNHRPGPQSDEFLRRVRAWPVSSWRHGDRIAATRRALDALAALAAAARGAEVPDGPDRWRRTCWPISWSC